MLANPLKTRLHGFVVVAALNCTVFATLIGSNPVTQRTQSGTTIANGFANKPTNCEINIIRMEAATKHAIEETAHGGVIIAIARLGNGERSREINRRRLHNVETYLTSYQTLAKQNVITAEGKRVKGYGRVELYLGGKLVDLFLVDFEKDLCVDCCEGDERYYPFFKAKKRR
jgi:hypothetical protein